MSGIYRVDQNIASLGKGIRHMFPAGDGLGGNYYVRPMFYYSVIQGVWRWVADYAGQVKNDLVWNSSSTDGDAIIFKFWMESGTYTLKAIGHNDSMNGILEFKIDGAQVSTWDQYAGATAWSDLHSETGISVSTSGIKTIQVGVNGKNGSSSGYQIVITDFVFYRTS